MSCAIALSWMGYFENFLKSQTYNKTGSKNSVARKKPYFDNIMFLLGVLVNRKFYYCPPYKFELVTHRYLIHECYSYSWQ